MAFVATGFRVTYTIIDKGSNITKKTLELRGADHDEAVTNAAAYRVALQNTMASVVLGYDVAQVFEEDTVVLPTGDTAINSMQAIMSGLIDGEPLKKATWTIPGPLPLVFVSTTAGANYDIVNPANSFVAALTNQYKATGSVFISDGEDLDANPDVVGVRRTVKRRLA